MGLDMEKLCQVFYEECRENLVVLEEQLIALQPQDIDQEVIDTIFRAAHSIKGGAATFNLTNISEFTHLVETYLDRVRGQDVQIEPDVIDTLLSSCDVIKGMLYAHEQGESYQSDLEQQVTSELNVLLSSDEAEKDSESVVNAESNQGGEDAYWQIGFKPDAQFFFSGNDPLRILREVRDLDPACEIQCNWDGLSDVTTFDAERCYLSWNLKVDGSVSRDDLDDIFEWVIDDCELAIELIESDIEELDPVDVIEQTRSSEHTEDAHSPNQPERLESTERKTTPATNTKTEQSVSSIRVDIDKVDTLINLVGELVITQSMLTEIGNDFSEDKLEKLNAGLTQLLQNSKDLQEHVLNIRMLPVSFAFNRFPRLVRDLSKQLNKDVDLIITGENTELDKTVLERIVDPLVHLVRNGIDHGLESSETREQNGKSQTGMMRLNAFHQGGAIVIEVEDDGAGINPDIVWNKAITKGLLPNDAVREEMTEQQIIELIFAPGFSTVEQVSDLSGRGVGMDVVKRNIEDLGGHIEVQSELGQGSKFIINLPLTLAILDGQLIRVADEVYVIPLLTIIESIQIDMSCINYAAGGMEFYRLREKNIPILRLQDEFGLGASSDLNDRILCFVEAAGHEIGIVLDELLEQQQVVIKSLETNYSKVSGISGATILGNGEVAFILDVQGLITQFIGRIRGQRKPIKAA